MSDSASNNGTPNRGIVREADALPPELAALPLALPPELAAAEEQPVVRLRNGTTVVNGQQQQANGHAAIQRGLEVLAEQEMDQNLEEIKKLDTQLDHFNKYLDTFEKKNNELTERLTTVIKTQREDRMKRRASFMQREEEYKAQQNSFENQVTNMLSRCAQSRRTSVPVFPAGVQDSPGQNRRGRYSDDGASSKDDKMDTQ